MFDSMAVSPPCFALLFLVLCFIRPSSLLVFAESASLKDSASVSITVNDKLWHSVQSMSIDTNYSFIPYLLFIPSNILVHLVNCSVILLNFPLEQYSSFVSLIFIVSLLA